MVLDCTGHRAVLGIGFDGSPDDNMAFMPLYIEQCRELDKDKDKDAKIITKTLTVCYIFGILMTLPVQPSTAQYSLVPPSTV